NPRAPHVCQLGWAHPPPPRTRMRDRARLPPEPFRAKIPLSLPASREEPGGHMLSFGVTVLPDPPYTRLIELTKLAEDHGVESGCTSHPHTLGQESSPTLPLVADRTERIKLGHFVTNPGIRDPTITASWY